MHTLFTIPELLLQITTFLPPHSLTNLHQTCHKIHTTLLTNLPAHCRPLPDHHNTHAHPPLLLLPAQIRTTAQTLHTQAILWCTSNQETDTDTDMPTDAYEHWWDHVCVHMLRILKPYIHPVLRRDLVRFCGGLEEVGRGGLGVVVRSCGWDWVGDGEGERERDNAFLTYPACAVVEVYCVEGAGWEEGYSNVLRREGWRAWERRCVRIERRGGVRMGDVCDEVRGVLRVDKMDEEGEREREREVVLEWRFSSSLRGRDGAAW
ncbi:hypothetical protein BDW02DRAFT_75490 [Decorospora gaudefroyi]|uniref:F-box domain-containing protein n=1 Tax=Decorospora gaudefroyi TaxID=184978 RepID=A0A6A5K1X6_9PLEO|nr:hypothetical protein BDW02DRAFT_75490 [Decorospora gaudefroyi]